MHYRTKGNEAERLVKLLRDEYPEARKLLTQPSVLKELWIYAETGRFRQAKMENALRPLTETSKRAESLRRRSAPTSGALCATNAKPIMSSCASKRSC